MHLLAAILAVAVWWAAPAQAADDPARLPVRFGVHPTFERMVFDWAQPTEYRVETKDGVTTVSFERNAMLDAASLIAGLTRVAGGVAVREEGGKLKVAMTLTDGTRLKHFRNGNKVVFDFSKTPDQRAAPEVEAGAESPLCRQPRPRLKSLSRRRPRSRPPPRRQSPHRPQSRPRPWRPPWHPRRRPRCRIAAGRQPATVPEAAPAPSLARRWPGGGGTRPQGRPLRGLARTEIDD